MTGLGTPLHALAMLKNAREGIVPDQPGVVGPIKQIEALQQKGFPLAYVGDVVADKNYRIFLNFLNNM